MVQPWRHLGNPDEIDIVAPDGAIRSRVKGYYSGNQFIVDDMTIDVRPGDEIRRPLPNGREEVFLVEDPKFYRGGHFGSHYQISISRPKIFERHTGGNYNINMSGPNSRVNIQSSDASTNTAIDHFPSDAFVTIQRLLDDIKSQISTWNSSNSTKSEIESDISQIEIEIQRPTPRGKFIKLYLESLRDNLAKAAGLSTATALAATAGTIAAKFFGIF